MNGEDLLKALSRVEDRYIQEAETAKLSKSRSYLWLAPVAACLVLALLLYPKPNEEHGDPISMEHYQEPGGAVPVETSVAMSETVASVAESDLPQATPAVEQSPEDLMPSGRHDKNDLVPGKPGEVPSLLVRIDAWQEGGFTATVEAIVDTDIYPAGTLVTVRFREGGIHIAEKLGSAVHYRCAVPTPEDFPEGTVVQILFQNEQGVLIAEQIAKEGVF